MLTSCVLTMSWLFAWPSRKSDSIKSLAGILLRSIACNWCSHLLFSCPAMFSNFSSCARQGRDPGHAPGGNPGPGCGRQARPLLQFQPRGHQAGVLLQERKHQAGRRWRGMCLPETSHASTLQQFQCAVLMVSSYDQPADQLIFY